MLKLLSTSITMAVLICAQGPPTNRTPPLFVTRMLRNTYIPPEMAGREVDLSRYGDLGEFFPSTPRRYYPYHLMTPRQYNGTRIGSPPPGYVRPIETLQEIREDINRTLAKYHPKWYGGATANTKAAASHDGAQDQQGKRELLPNETALLRYIMGHSDKENAQFYDPEYYTRQPYTGETYTRANYIIRANTIFFLDENHTESLDSVEHVTFHANHYDHGGDDHHPAAAHVHNVHAPQQQQAPHHDRRPPPVAAAAAAKHVHYATSAPFATTGKGRRIADGAGSYFTGADAELVEQYNSFKAIHGPHTHADSVEDATRPTHVPPLGDDYPEHRPGQHHDHGLEEQYAQQMEDLEDLRASIDWDTTTPKPSANFDAVNLHFW